MPVEHKTAEPYSSVDTQCVGCVRIQPLIIYMYIIYTCYVQMNASLPLSPDVLVCVTASLKGELNTTLMYEVPHGCTLTDFKGILIGR